MKVAMLVAWKADHLVSMVHLLVGRMVALMVETKVAMKVEKRVGLMVA
jgi:hypothetical protein